MRTTATGALAMLVLATLGGLDGRLEAAQHLVNPQSLEAGISRNRLVSIARSWVESGRVPAGRASAGGGFVAADLEVNFHCGWNREMERVQVFSPFDSVERIYDRASNPPERHKRGVLFERFRVAQIADLVAACIASGGPEAEHEAELVLMADCQAVSPIPIVFEGWDISTVKLPIQISCREVIPADHAFARVSVERWQHECPSGFVVEGTEERVALLEDRESRDCVRAPTQ